MISRVANLCLFPSHTEPPKHQLHLSNVEKRRKQRPNAGDNDNTLMLGHMLDASSGLDSSSCC